MMKSLKSLYATAYPVVMSVLASAWQSWKRHWLKNILSAAVMLVLMIVTATLIQKAWDSRDIGSDSWFAWLSGPHVEDNPRGTSLPPAASTDELGDPAPQAVVHLPQGWSVAQSMWFYNISQGSDLMPYDFFLALEQTGSAEPFRDNQNMNHYRYLTQIPTVSNPDGLPVGFVKDRYAGKSYMGFTCAACHTGQIDYTNPVTHTTTAIRVDGAPAMADMDTFLYDLGLATCKVIDPGPAHDRFVQKVLSYHHYSNEKEVSADLAQTCQSLVLYNVINHSDTAYGYARLDAFGRIYNRVLQNVYTLPELKSTFTEISDDLKDVDYAKDGLHPDARQNNPGYRAAVLADIDIDPRTKRQKTTRENLTDELTKASVLCDDPSDPKNCHSLFIDRTFNSPDAPVSYPFLWDIPQHDYVQWNGIGSNAGLGPLGRNTGEVIGVFATLDWEQKPGTSISSFISGQGIHATHTSFGSSIKMQNLRLIEDQLRDLQSPLWNDAANVLGAVDEKKVKRGQVLYEERCISCHARLQRDDPTRRVVASMESVDKVGTDPVMASNAATRTGYSGILRNEYVSIGPGDLLVSERAPVAAILTKATFSVVATPEHEINVFARAYNWLYYLLASKFGNEIQPSLKQGEYTPDTSAAPVASLSAYKGRPLNGIWATAPYLHNGSVPTLYDLLLPSRADVESCKPATDKPCTPPRDGLYRPDTFLVGTRQFDTHKVGFLTSGYKGFLFDTSIPGNANTGHNYGTDLSDADRYALVEYLKTL